MDVEELDGLDMEILRLLQEDGRISYSDIAKQLRVHENTIRFRVRRLIDRGVIRKIVALVDPKKIGLTHSAAFMIKADPKKVDSVASVLASMKEVTNVYQFTGEYDFIVVTFASDMKSMQDLINKVKKIDGIREVNVLMTTNVIKSEVRYSLLTS
ncbi:MAG: Lrp/AsnC family transcriptional regulator [Aigarchaeota archaeon]|nr:Lrp/AsnC family transcriptional regulator [Aigarchaeota archaeon]MDW8092596.1 Lrp/AsnC family transcriptional regulator [Nitrososphaerota archaeon]